MEVYIDGNKLVIITEPNIIHFDSTKDIDENLKHKTDSIIKHNKFLPEHRIKTKLDNYYSKISMETIIMITENSKTNEPQEIQINMLLFKACLFITPGEI